MPASICPRCSKKFTDKSNYNRHLARKTPCAAIIDQGDQNSPNTACKFCGRAFSSRSHMLAHVQKACKIAPRAGNPNGMEKLYEHTLKKQQAQIEQLTAAMAAQRAEVAAMKAEKGPAPTSITTNNTQTMVANVDNSQNKITTTVNIGMFGKENLGRITKPQIFSILKSLGEVGSAGENLRTICDRAILQTAMIIFSDPAHPEDITCYIPNKKGESALVHGERGWEVQPVSLVMSPMASQAVEALFKYQPVPEGDMPQQDVKWVMGECGRILRYLADHEGSLVNEPMRGELRGILIRNKDLLSQVLARLPMAGEA